MPRPQKQKVDYFPHMTKHGETMFIIEERFGNDGYALWFKTLEKLGDTEGHAYDCGDPSKLAYLAAKAHLSTDRCIEILGSLAELEAIDPELWNDRRMVWCQNFVDNVAPVYEKRIVDSPMRPDIRDGNKRKTSISGTGNPQSRVEKRKEEKREYAPRVHLTEKEYGTFVSKYGKEQTEKLVDTLDAYKQSKGKTYKSDAGAIRSWVIDKVGPREISRALAICERCGENHDGKGELCERCQSLS